MPMSKRILPTILISALLLSGCTASPANPLPAPPPASGTEEPAPSPQREPGQNPPADPDPTDTDPVDPAPQPAEPVVAWKPPAIGMPLSPSDSAVQQKVAMLTFDDGPSAYTPAVLDGLAAAKVKAVFFITGYGAAQHPELVERIHREGHLLGIHTMTHPNMTNLDAAEQLGEIKPLVDLIQQVTGEPPRYFRPPFGAYNDTLLKTLADLNLELINWSNGSLDWDGVVDGYKDPNQVVADVMGQLHNGAVILAHDTMKHTAEAVPGIIEQIRAEGYEFVILP